MPTKSSERWIDDGNNMVKVLQDLGYETDLQYAEDVIENQVSQLENMITTGVDCLVIASIDGEALGQVLNKAGEEGIPVIAYDRLIRGSEFVDYYATFDNFKVGVQQATTLSKVLVLMLVKQVLSTLSSSPVLQMTTMLTSSSMAPCQYFNLISMMAH
jgi:putative multiple sugar transport system substrate-binding protein